MTIDEKCIWKLLSEDKKSTTFQDCNDKLKQYKEVCYGYNKECKYYVSQMR